MKFLIIAIILVVALFFFRSKIFKIFLDKEIVKIQDLNYSDEEIKYLKKKYSDYDSDYLISLKNSATLTEKEFLAVQKVLDSREINPTFGKGEI